MYASVNYLECTMDSWSFGVLANCARLRFGHNGREPELKVKGAQSFGFYSSFRSKGNHNRAQSCHYAKVRILKMSRVHHMYGKRARLLVACPESIRKEIWNYSVFPRLSCSHQVSYMLRLWKQRERRHLIALYSSGSTSLDDFFLFILVALEV